MLAEIRGPRLIDPSGCRIIHWRADW